MFFVMNGVEVVKAVGFMTNFKGDAVGICLTKEGKLVTPKTGALKAMDADTKEVQAANAKMFPPPVEEKTGKGDDKQKAGKVQAAAGKPTPADGHIEPNKEDKDFAPVG